MSSTGIPDCGTPESNRRAVAVSLALDWFQGNLKVDIDRIFRTTKAIDEWIASGTVPDPTPSNGVAVSGQQLNAIADHIPPG